MITKTFFNKNFLYGSIVCVILLIPYVILYSQNVEQRNNFTKEDGIIENLSAIFFLLASIVFFILFFKFKTEEKIYFFKQNRNYFLFLLALFFFVCFGEEISWGQRIFNIGTPAQWKGINSQGELNLHNLYFLQPGDDKTGIAKWFTSNRLFFLFWFFFCMVIPIAYKLSLKLKIFIKKIHFPIVPLWLGIVFLLNQLIASGLEVILPLNRDNAIEVKETNYGLLFLFLGIYFYMSIYGTKRRQELKGEQFIE